MPIDILVPPLSQTADTVTLVEWLKTVGDTVVKGQPLFVIETDKANLEIEAPASGILRQILAEPGAEVEVRSKIGLIAVPDETLPAAPGLPPSLELQAVQPPVAHHPLVIAADPGGQPLPLARQQRIFASPRARRVAEQAGVSLAEVTATGPQQMIVERDVRAYLVKTSAPPLATPVARRMAQQAGLDLAAVTPEYFQARITRADVTTALAQRATEAPQGRQSITLSPTRRIIARRLLEGLQTTAQVTLTREVDATELVHLREQLLQELSPGDPRPTYTDFLVSMVARQLKQHPYLNATGDDDHIELSEAVHLGLAVDTERGLVVPIMRYADQKGVLQLARERADLVKRTLEGTITPTELNGGTFTLTNLGALGVDAFTPLLNPPQTAILGVGRIHPGAAVYEGALCVRQLMVLSLTFDHRFVDGAPAARFLADVVRLIEKPHLRWL